MGACGIEIPFLEKHITRAARPSSPQWAGATVAAARKNGWPVKIRPISQKGLNRCGGQAPGGASCTLRSTLWNGQCITLHNTYCTTRLIHFSATTTTATTTTATTTTAGRQAAAAPPAAPEPPEPPEPRSRSRPRPRQAGRQAAPALLILLIRQSRHTPMCSVRPQI